MHEEEKLMEEVKRLRTKLKVLSKVLQNMKEGVLIFDDRGKIKSANESFASMIGFDRRELYGVKVSDLDFKWGETSSFEEVMETLKEEGLWKGEVWGVHRSGTMFTGEVSLLKANEDCFVGIFLDTTDRSSLEANLRSMVYYDPITGLPNRAFLYDHLTHLIQKARSENGKVAVVFFDIDNFKLINDTLGHDVGDSLLRSFSQRLMSHFPRDALVARFGSDEFVVVMETKGKEEDIRETVEHFIQNATLPFFINGQKIYITVSAGVSFYPTDGLDAQTLLRNADIAMHHAKEAGKSSLYIFTRELDLKLSERFTLQADLREALQKEEFALYYQPQFELSTNTVVGMEALIRWHHPKKGIILPGRFMPIVEETDLVVPLGNWILKRACLDGRKLLDEGIPLKVAVNVSTRQISSKNFISTLKSIIKETGFDPNFLEIEITESTLMKNKQEAAEILKELKDLGISIAIDDFGTSYSALNYLKYLPVDKLKIDKSFIDNVNTDPNDNAIATTIIAIAHNLGLKAVAEGVETEDQLIFLKLWQCDIAQGFYFSPPITFESILEMLRNRNFKIKGV
ncbi:MAG: EAL domain-containing protein [Aquificae bacterium]|nr:EAL domain-containing protein [Aquificota bacterium]